MGDDSRAAQAARVSFLQDEERTSKKRDDKLIRFLHTERHTSPFEHSVITFRLKVPLFIARQIMRHRTFSYNENSRRYSSEAVEFHIPAVLRQQAEKNLQCSVPAPVADNVQLVQSIKQATDSAFSTYQMLLDSGVAREQARCILPQNMYTTFWMTGNLHNYTHFLGLRLGEHAQQEAREVAGAMLEHLKVHFPVTMDVVGL
jgi:thymidylate synthase (FAD)